MNEHFIKEGFSSYYVVKRTEGFPYEEKILIDQKCRSVLPFEIRRVDEERYYYFHISGYLSLEQKMRNKKNSVEAYRSIYKKMIEAINEIEEYLLPPEGILLESDHIFYDEDQQHICFCYLPGRNKDLMQQLLDLTEEFLEMINYEDRDLVEYLYQIHESISKGRLPIFDESHEKKESIEEESSDIEEELWEEEKPFFREEAEVKQSGKWYAELAVSICISVGIIFLIGYQLLTLYEIGWTTERIKILVILSFAFLFNFIYLTRKMKVKTMPEKFTTILTEEESIDKIGES